MNFMTQFQLIENKSMREKMKSLNTPTTLTVTLTQVQVISLTKKPKDMHVWQ